jgi:hypothetical protein
VRYEAGLGDPTANACSSMSVMSAGHAHTSRHDKGM